MTNNKLLDFGALLASDEDTLLNGIWIGLLSVEALMVLGVALRGLVGAVVSSRWWSRCSTRSRHPAQGRMAPPLEEVKQWDTANIPVPS